ncbi:MAG TPA: 7TM diverse intracellular signaling domain-containing protein [Flavipsychrobacter sp.]|nr:7TM diverse intracellular signaling domain-containing protein [Flavipsychrobacter sp.]
MNRPFFRFLVTAILIFICTPHSWADTVLYDSGRILIGNQVEILNDSLNKYTPQDAINSPLFFKSKQTTPNFDISNSTYWIKFSIKNITSNPHLLLEIDNALVDTCNLYFVRGNEVVLLQSEGTAKKYSSRRYKYPDFIYDLEVGKDSTVTYLLKVKSSEQLLVPMIVGTPQSMAEAQNTKDVISGIHIGVLLVMILYNFFIFLSTRDRSYLFYVLYILFIGLTQTILTGYSFKYLFPNNPSLFNYAIVVSPSLAGISAIYFIKSFLHTRQRTPILNKLLWILVAMYAVAASIRLAGFDQLSSRAVDITALLAAVIVYIIVIKLSLQNYRPAKFFLLAWTIFILGLVLFVLRNLNILPYSNFTNYTMQVGTVIEVTLLSIALADKINILDRERKISQAEALRVAQENERIIREQNVFLESKVTERTVELQASNNELNKTLKELKDAETQLVESEKMASLGQLTAGIAHEINNPINFVTSNIKPLKRDVSILLDAVQAIENVSIMDSSIAEKQKQISEYKAEIDFDYLKEEIDHLLKGIGEGASRTAEIVKGLRIFSRLDEDDLKKADINEGLDSTLVIINNLLNNRIKVIKEYGNLPLIECYPGKLNQVFLNMITNAIHAINKQHETDDNGALKISTTNDEQNVYIKIKDNGTGMDENTKKKLFEPFFTTKDVGEGTGLGLSIAYNTIKKHNGVIHVNSTLGEGTEFIIELPIIH